LRLRDNVVAADERPVPVDADETRDEEQPACGDRIRVVRDRLCKPFDPIFAAVHPA
jgi:hypothetical protein